jgi:hypothetical protein
MSTSFNYYSLKTETAPAVLNCICSRPNVEMILRFGTRISSSRIFCTNCLSKVEYGANNCLSYKDMIRKWNEKMESPVCRRNDIREKLKECISALHRVVERL